MVLGSLAEPKGRRIVEGLCAGPAPGHTLYLVGSGRDVPPVVRERANVVPGGFEHSELQRIAETIRPDVALLPSTAVEIFSFALSDCFDLAMPPVAPRCGAFVDRIEDGRSGFLFEPHDVDLCDLLRRLSRDRRPLAEHLHAHQEEDRREQDEQQTRADRIRSALARRPPGRLRHQ